MADHTPVMAHMVAGYPTGELSFAAARGLIDGGATYLEIQFPFSDPTADGPVIQEACRASLEEGFSVNDGFYLIEQIREYSSIPLFIMTYASLVFAAGVERFVRRAEEAGVAGLIVPDLAPFHDEGLYDAGARAAVHIVPVVVPSMREERLEEIAALQPVYLYAALRAGVTGEQTGFETVYRYLEKLSRFNAGLFAGFGIRTRKQVEALSSRVHAAVIGTALVQVVREAAGSTDAGIPGESLYRKIRDAVHYFV